jgi:predicted O-linked N-acetylglucosamine transferase (SPINDLY family)
MSQPPQQVTIQQAIELAIAHERAGRLAEAEQVFLDILRQRPDEPGTLHLYGCLALHAGNLPAAAQLIRRSVQFGPEVPQRHNDLGVVLQSMGRSAEAAEAYRAALKLDPDLVDALANLSALLSDTGRLDEALLLAQRAVELNAGHAPAWNNVGRALTHLGRAAEAVLAYRRAVEAAPANPHFQSNVCLTSHYLPDVDPAALFAEHRRYGRQMEAAAAPARPARYVNKRAADRKLRVGYVSADFRQHSVGYFIEAAIEKHDRAAFEVVCYSDVDIPDSMTTRMQAQATGWRAIHGLPNESVVRLVQQDQIDILVDLAGHTSRNRLPVFAAKPAPVQVSYLGYPNTTGLSAMDYRITDSHVDPPGGDADQLSVEKLIRLDPCAWCYRPPEPHPPVAPAAGERPVTFGTFNAIAKVNEPLIATWSAILREVPESRFFMKAGGLAAPSAAQRVRAQFISNGIEAERVELVSHVLAASQHLAAYAQLDIALDTFPYHGTTTTCEAMWMGVPVVTLAGRTHAGRVGVSLLSNLKLTELIAPDREAYVQIAVELARDRKRLASLRQGLRQRMLASPLMNGFDFTRRLEAAYRTMWRQWCDSGRARA